MERSSKGRVYGQSARLTVYIGEDAGLPFFGHPPVPAGRVPQHLGIDIVGILDYLGHNSPVQRRVEK